MHGETLNIHFSLPATDSLGRMHVDGKLRCLDEKVVLQYKVRGRTFKKAGNELQTIEFPYREVEHVEYASGWFRRRLILKTNDPAVLERMPGADLGRIEMHIGKKSRRDAAKIEAFVDFKQSMALAEESHERWEQSRGEGESI